MEIMQYPERSNVCRVCFEVRHDIRSLFAINNGDRSVYESLVKDAKLNVHENDGGPAAICGQCVQELNIFVKFLNKCKRANKIFQQFKENIRGTSHGETPNCNMSVLSEENIDINFTANDNDDTSAPTTKESLVPHWSAQKNLTQAVNIDTLLGVQGVKSVVNKPVSYTCQLCCKMFTRKFNYKLHLLRHSGERQWWCRCGAPALTRALARGHCERARRACPAPGCGKSFTTVTNLNTHIRKHNGERPYICGECGKTFGSKNTLREHIRIHTGVKAYLCPACGKQFATNKLAAHMRTHAARAHACAACARRFPSARAVRLHARTHAAPARAHACAACPARYNHKQSLNKHLRKRHGLKTS